jgi:hypothetical protein
LGMAETPERDTAGSTPPEEVPALAPELPEPPEAKASAEVPPVFVDPDPFVPVVDALVDGFVAPVLDLVEVVPVLPAVVAPVVPVDFTPPGGDVTVGPVAVPPLAPGGGAVTVTTPQVGVVAPVCTSVGVRSPHEYADCSAAVGETAPGTFFKTALIPYCSRDKPRLA